MFAETPRDARPFDAPGPGEQLTDGPVATPRQAATVILLRGGSESLQVLLVQRTPDARFMGGVWVFPGGALDPAEIASAEGHRLAAVRELREEAAVSLPPEAELIEFSRWITPRQVKIRFDARFFLAELPEGASPRVDGSECIAHGWFEPAEALAANEAGEIALVFPTIKHLERLSRFHDAAQLLSDARGRQIGPVQPEVLLDGDAPRIVIPGEGSCSPSEQDG